MITKNDVLENLEQIKGYINEIDNKKVEKVVGIAIKNRWTGDIIFQSTKTTYKEAIIEKGNANLRDADLRDAELNNAKFYGRGGTQKLTEAQLPDFLNALGFQVEN